MKTKNNNSNAAVLDQPIADTNAEPIATELNTDNPPAGMDIPNEPTDTTAEPGDTTPPIVDEPATVEPVDIFALPAVRTVAEYLLAEYVARNIGDIAGELHADLAQYFTAMTVTRPRAKRAEVSADSAKTVADKAVRDFEKAILAAVNAEQYDTLPGLKAQLVSARQVAASATTAETRASSLRALQLMLTDSAHTSEDKLCCAPYLSKRAAEYSGSVIAELREVKLAENGVLNAMLASVTSLDTLTATEFVPIAVIGKDAHTARIHATELDKGKLKAEKSLATSEALMVDAIANNAPESDIKRLTDTIAGAKGHLTSITHEATNAWQLYEKARDDAKKAYAVAFPSTD